jgi:hypothetical protein
LKAAAEAGGCKNGFKSHLPFHQLYVPLNMEITVMAIEASTTWHCGWETLWMHSGIYSHNMTTYSCLTTQGGMTSREKLV